jgi:hypothetical protein
MSRWTEADLMAHMARRGKNDTPLESTRIDSKPSKYRNVKTVVDGQRFDSQREAGHWMALRAREAAGEITDLQRQVSFPLMCPEMDNLGLAQRGGMFQVAVYVADFVYRERGSTALVVVDAKGRRIAPYPLKKKWLYLQQGIEILEV